MDGRYWETVRLLVEAGVDVDETCRSTGLTPLGNRAANSRQGVGPLTEGCDGFKVPWGAMQAIG